MGGNLKAERDRMMENLKELMLEAIELEFKKDEDGFCNVGSTEPLYDEFEGTWASFQIEVERIATEAGLEVKFEEYANGKFWIMVR